MISLLSEGLDEYIRRHSTEESELLSRLREETQASLAYPQMQVGPVEGAFLRLMVQMSGARRVLEIGTYSGYSALAMAAGLPADGRLVTCDIDPKATAVAQRYFDQSPDGHKIELRLGPAIETIAALEAEGEAFDLVFIDADKTGYVSYWEALLPTLPSGAVVLADNTLWSGRVLDPTDDDDHAIVQFNTRVASDPRVDHVLLSVRDGVMFARKL